MIPEVPVVMDSNHIVFCEECRDDVDYVIEEQQREGNLKGKKYKYNGKVAHCAVCESEIYVGEINDYNLEALYDVYYKANGISRE